MSKTERVFPLNTLGGKIQNRRINILNKTRPEFYDLVRPGEKIGNDSKSRTIKNWESGETIPDIDTIKKICKVLDCSSDYLLGLNDCTSKDNQFIHDKTGLSEKAINRISTPKGNLFLDTLITSNEFYEIDTYFSQLETVINHFNSCYKSLKQCEEKAQSIEKGTTEYQENDELYFSLMHSAQRWDAEQTSNIYMMGILFGKLLDEYKKKNLINIKAPGTD